MTIQSGFTKVAVRREEGYPIGVSAPLYLICLCGKKHGISHPDGTPCDFIKCECGKEYDHAGWIVK